MIWPEGGDILGKEEGILAQSIRPFEEPFYEAAENSAPAQPPSRSREQGSTYLRLGQELKDRALAKAARERVDLSGAVRLLVSLWVAGKIQPDLSEIPPV